MKRIDYMQDCKRIQSTLGYNGYYADIPECQDIWQQYSLPLAASWMCLPRTEFELDRALMDFIRFDPVGRKFIEK